LRIRLKPWAFFTLLAIATAATLFAIAYYRHRFVRSDSDMSALLPPGDATIFFADVAALRRAGALNLPTGPSAMEEPDYREFVRQTAFDYTKNLDAIAGAADGRQVFLVLRGRFDWIRLQQYAVSHGGTCVNTFCRGMAGKSGRWTSFLAIQPDVMGLALSGNTSAASALRPPGRRLSERGLTGPAWVKVSQALLKNPSSLPLPMRIFAISLQSADPVVLSLGPDRENGGAVLSLRLDAQCSSAATAETTRNQLEIETKMLKLELDHEHRRANTADLTGLLTAGTFQVKDKGVVGTWPVRRELLNALK